MTPPPVVPDAVALVARVRALRPSQRRFLPYSTEPILETMVPDAALRALCALAEQGMADTRRLEPTDECRHGYAVCEPCAFDRGYAAGQRGDPLDADEPTPLFDAMGLPPVPPIPRAATQEVPDAE